MISAQSRTKEWILGIRKEAIGLDPIWSIYFFFLFPKPRKHSLQLQSLFLLLHSYALWK